MNVMLQHCVLESNWVQEDIFNIIKIMDSMHQYQAKYEIEFNFLKRASSLPIKDLKGSTRFPSVTMEWENFERKNNFVFSEELSEL